jgi:hypothetical protein
MVDELGARSPAHHRPHRLCVVAPRLHCGDELGEYLLPLALLLLQGLDALKDLSLQAGYVQVPLQGLFCRPHLQLCGPEVALKELDDILELLPDSDR